VAEVRAERPVAPVRVGARTAAVAAIDRAATSLCVKDSLRFQCAPTAFHGATGADVREILERWMK